MRDTRTTRGQFTMDTVQSIPHVIETKNPSVKPKTADLQGFRKGRCFLTYKQMAKKTNQILFAVPFVPKRA